MQRLKKKLKPIVPSRLAPRGFYRLATTRESHYSNSHGGTLMLARISEIVTVSPQSQEVA